MRKQRLIGWLLTATCLVSVQSIYSSLWAQNNNATNNVWMPDNGDGTFTNPILWGDWADPDAIRVGDDFYLIGTSMQYVPGCPSGVLYSLWMGDEGRTLFYLYSRQNRWSVGTDHLSRIHVRSGIVFR